MLTILTELNLQYLQNLQINFKLNYIYGSKLHYSSNKPHYEHNFSLTVVVYGNPKTD